MTDEETEEAKMEKLLHVMEAEGIKQYLDRGRRHSSMSLEALKVEWCDAVRALFAQRNRANCQREEDAGSELVIRGFDPQILVDSNPDIGELYEQFHAESPPASFYFDPDLAPPAVTELIKKMSLKN